VLEVMSEIATRFKHLKRSLWARRPGVDRKQIKVGRFQVTTLVRPSLFGGRAVRFRWRRELAWGTARGSVGRWPPSRQPRHARCPEPAPCRTRSTLTFDKIIAQLETWSSCCAVYTTRHHVATWPLSRDRHLVIDLVATWPLTLSRLIAIS